MNKRVILKYFSKVYVMNISHIAVFEVSVVQHERQPVHWAVAVRGCLLSHTLTSTAAFGLWQGTSVPVCFPLIRAACVQELHLPVLSCLLLSEPATRHGSELTPRCGGEHFLPLALSWCAEKELVATGRSPRGWTTPEGSPLPLPHLPLLPLVHGLCGGACRRSEGDGGFSALPRNRKPD